MKNETNENAGRARGDVKSDLIAFRGYLKGLRSILVQDARTLADYGSTFRDPKELPGFATQGGIGWEAWNVRADLDIARRAIDHCAEVSAALIERLEREGGAE